MCVAAAAAAKGGIGYRMGLPQSGARVWEGSVVGVCDICMGYMD